MDALSAQQTSSNNLRLSMLPGVAQVQVYGSQQYAVHVQVDPVKMAANNIGIDQVSNIISSSNVNLPTGAFYRVRIFTQVFKLLDSYKMLKNIMI